MSDVECFIRFCESDFGTAVMDREATYLRQFVTPVDRSSMSGLASDRSAIGGTIEW